jgi:lysophospholipase L1-like esterase
VLLAGTNNLPDPPLPSSSISKADEIAMGLQAIVRTIQEKAPDAVLVVMGIFPRNDHMEFMPVIHAVNHKLDQQLAGDRKVRFLDIDSKLAREDGELIAGTMNPDKLHPTLQGYQVWADALNPMLLDLLGPRAAVDRAGPATGDPSVVAR